MASTLRTWTTHSLKSASGEVGTRYNSICIIFASSDYILCNKSFLLLGDLVLNDLLIKESALDVLDLPVRLEYGRLGIKNYINNICYILYISYTQLNLCNNATY